MKSKSMKLNRRMLLALAAATVALPFVTPVDAFAGTVEEAKAKGKVVIGIQGDNSPWGFVNSSGVQDGLDADIGKAFADYLGVKAEFVLRSAGRCQPHSRIDDRQSRRLVRHDGHDCRACQDNPVFPALCR